MMATYRKGTIQTADFMFDTQTGAMLVEVVDGAGNLVNPGNNVHGEVSSANASAGVAVTLYTAGTITPVRPLASNEHLNITDVLVTSPANLGFSLEFAGADTAGARIVKSGAAVPGIAMHFNTPVKGPAGVAPTLIAAMAGQIDLVLSGFITTS
jgi:hypothetical protein